MGASHTKNESWEIPETLTKQQFNELLAYTTKYISNWTQRELKSISKNKRIPVCWPISNGGFVIGTDRVIPENGYWQRYNRDNERAQLFSNKQAAIFYSLCYQVGHTKLAQGLYNCDEQHTKLKNDIQFYSHSLESAISNKDCSRICILSARLDDAKLRFLQADADLKKSLKSARQLKIWTE